MINGTIRHSFTALAVTALVLSSANFAFAAQHRGLKRAARHTAHLAAVGRAAAPTAPDALITGWSFETNTPADATAATYPNPVPPDFGSGSGAGVHASASTNWTTPAGNGSANAFSSEHWAIGDYYQFTLSTAGMSGIFVTFSATGSSTGPRDFSLQYTTDGATYIPFAAYAVLENSAVNGGTWGGTYRPLYQFTFDLSGIAALNNNPNAGFRLVDTSTVSTSGGVVGTAGSSRVDDFFVSSGAPVVVPEPATSVLIGVGLLLVAQRFIRRKTN